MLFSVRKAALTLFLSSLCSLFPFSLLGQELTLETQVGFQGLFHLGHPFPLTVEVGNLGRPVEGLLEVKVWKGGATKGVEPYLVQHQKEISLSAQAKKRVQFTVEPDSISRPVTVTFSTRDLRLSKEVDLRRFFSPTPLVLLLTEDKTLPTIPLISGSLGPLVSLSMGELPDDSRAYQGISTIIFYEQSLRDFSKSKIEALDRWLSSGGRLLILGSIHYALYQEPSLSRFLPVRIAGLRELSALPSLEASYGKRSSFLKNLLVQDSQRVAGTVLIQEKGTPILVETARGRGQIFYLAADIGRPPLSRWEGLPLLFKDLVRSSVGSETSPQTSWDESMFSQLLLEPSFLVTYVPLRSFFVWMLFYLGGLAVLAWLWLQQRFPRRRVVLALVLLVSFSSFGGCFHFERGGYMPDGVLLSSTLLETHPDGYSEAESNVALFSTQGREYNLHVGGGWSDFRPVPRLTVSQDGVLRVQEEGSSTRFQLTLREWDYRLFRMRSMSYFPFRVELQKQENQLTVKLSNLTAKDVTGCWLVASGQKFFLGDIPRGSTQTREIQLSSEAPAEPSVFYSQSRTVLREITFGDKTQEFLFRSSLFPQDQTMAPWSGGSALIFGWVQEAPRRVWADQAGVLERDYTLVRAVIPLGEEDDM
ncbi:MAG: hypothetical protein E6J89_01985 [Deltaproteobacteria bacterium]|nr:MAG: hypothetical protein E6J89_01985 [Deltaproteobacteria bacterium]